MSIRKVGSEYARHVGLAEQACKFLSASPDPFHAVHNCITKLKADGYTKLTASEPFTGQLQAGGKYYYTVEHSTIVAFCVGKAYQPGTAAGFHMIGGHTDSPNLKIKPRSQKSASGGCTVLGVECYGGGLWHTWFDRDLSVSGRVMLHNNNNNNNKDGGSRITQTLVNLEDPIARISTLCIHLQSADERKGFAVNKENHTAPIIATTATTTTTSTESSSIDIASKDNKTAKEALEQGVQEQIMYGSEWRNGQEPLLLQAIAEKLQVTVDQIIDFELNLYDTQPATLGGIQTEFLYSARLDNLATVFCAVESLVRYSQNLPEASSDISLVVAFDHEEVGSTSAQGAGSPVMQDAVQRISAALNGGNISPDLYNATIRKSFILSIDQAHAIHPNYANKHEAQHAPTLNGGVVIKTNSNQRYATNGLTAFVVRELGRMANIPGKYSTVQFSIL
jgi:aspartyl aminopeptidase